MLRITPMKNSAKAKDYYLEALCQQDAAGRERYYSENQEVVGNWNGLGAKRLGLSGPVEQRQFDALCDNVNPNTGSNLTPRTKEDRRVGYDFNFHVPKSVSLVHAMTGDERITAAFREAVQETMKELEADTRTRVRVGGQDHTRTTGEMTWATFEHYTARPVNGIPDCHLHAHVVCFNNTWDAEEKRWKAMDVSCIKRDSTYYESAFHNRFAENLKRHGFSIERTAKRWELAGIAKATTDKFQERTDQIEKLADELGVTGDAKDALGARTRENKAKDFTRSELREIWGNRLTGDERDAIAAVIRHEVAGTSREPSIDRAFDYARKHAFERNSVVSERRFMAMVMNYGVGSFSVEDVNAEARRAGNGLITREIDGQRLTTTPEVLREEQKMLAFAREGRGVCRPLADGLMVGDAELSKEQVAAVKHLWDSGDRVTMLRGGAGVGKTRLIREAVAGVESVGVKVHAFAPAADASRGTLRREGFSEANTLASLLTSKKVQEQVKNAVIWCDEAGQIGTRDLARLFEIAHEQNARIWLSGDIRQHGPVSRGDGMRLLETQAGIVPAEVLEIRRQEGEYKSAVKAISEGDAAEGFRILDSLDFIQEIEGDERHQKLAADYVEALGKHRGAKALDEALCIAPTHSEAGKITAEIRGGLKRSKRLGKEERSFLQLRKTSLTEAERSDAVQYQAGDIVQLTQNIRGFSRGERLTVTNRDETGALLATRDTGEQVHVPIWHADRLQLFKESKLAVAKGETLRVTNNGYTAPGLFGKKHSLDNGSLHTVKGFTRNGDIKLSNGWVIPKDFGHLEHGYCQTSYSSQSRTVKRVFIAQGAESLPATDMRQFYVSVSRGKIEAKIYTDSKEDLLAAVMETEERLSAVEMLAGADATSERNAEQDHQLGQISRVRGLAEAQIRRLEADANAKREATIGTMGRVKALAEGQELIQRETVKPVPPPHKVAREHQRQNREIEHER